MSKIKVKKVEITLADGTHVFGQTVEDAVEKAERIEEERQNEIARGRRKIAYDKIWEPAYRIMKHTLLRQKNIVQFKPSWYYINSPEQLSSRIKGGDSDGYGRMLQVDTSESAECKTDEGQYIPKPTYRLHKACTVMGLLEDASGYVIAIHLKDSDCNDEETWYAVSSWEGELEVMPIPYFCPKAHIKNFR